MVLKRIFIVYIQADMWEYKTLFYWDTDRIVTSGCNFVNPLSFASTEKLGSARYRFQSMQGELPRKLRPLLKISDISFSFKILQPNIKFNL